MTKRGVWIEVNGKPLRTEPPGLLWASLNFSKAAGLPVVYKIEVWDHLLLDKVKELVATIEAKARTIEADVTILVVECFQHAKKSAPPGKGG